MKQYIKILFIMLIGIMVVSDASAQTKIKVAVYTTGDVDSSIKKIIGSKMVTAITNSGQFVAVERTTEFLAALSKESDYQTSGEVRDSQIAKLGQKFGVKYVIVADVNEAFDELFVASRLINVETGLVEGAYDANGSAESMQQLINLSNEIVRGLLTTVSSTTQNEKRSQIAVSNQNIIQQINHTKGSGKILGHEYVDLGLPSGLKWATSNVGTFKPAGRGDVYKGSGNDIANSEWGGSWRLPSKEECEELLWNCDWLWIENFGYKVTGPNGNSIYLPAARSETLGGAGDYLTSTLWGYDQGKEVYYTLFFNNDKHEMNNGSDYGTIRPVTF